MLFYWLHVIEKNKMFYWKITVWVDGDLELCGTVSNLVQEPKCSQKWYGRKYNEPQIKCVIITIPWNKDTGF